MIMTNPPLPELAHPKGFRKLIYKMILLFFC